SAGPHPSPSFLSSLTLVEISDQGRVVSAIALGPGRVRLGLLAPSDQVGELSSAKRFTYCVTIVQSPPLQGRVRFLRHPFRESLPLTNQTLMADVDYRVGGKWFLWIRFWQLKNEFLMCLGISGFD